ncbi:MAG: hypothetical protein GX247_04840, partial [Mollicutes bacterium]|nr:hypothetical protein [Mollicutes bacterium]
MLGSIIGIQDNTVLVKLNIELDQFENLINLHVVMEEPNKKFVGEIVDIKENIAYINLLGEIKDEKFVFGVI